MIRTKTPLNTPLRDTTELMRYQIIKSIACGGSSFVYLATNDKKQLVAIKEYLPQKMLLREREQADLTIPPDCIRKFRENLRTFFAEYRTLSRITHPGIVQLIDFFRANKTFYIVTNYDPGASLRDIIRRRFKRQTRYKTGSLIHAYFRYYRRKNLKIGSRQIMGERLIRNVFPRIMDALKIVHAQEFLYLDLKPGNIYLRHDGTPVLLDFGAARRILEKNRRKLNWVYTLSFAAPELLEKQRSCMGPWTDAYSIGATMFACMSGYSPQPANQRAVKDKMPQALKALRRLYSGDLIDVVEWCLQLDRTQRPQTLSALQEKLLAGRYVAPHRPKPGWRRLFCKWLRARIKHYRSLEKMRQVQ